MDIVTLEIAAADIAIVRINHPPVNALGRSVRAGLVKTLSEALTLPVTAVLLMGEGPTFCAGGDIREFDSPLREPHLNRVIELCESTAKPVIAVIHGVALGGGLELALGCSYRIATVDSRFGLPEAKLGILPGGGGTQRLTRLIGPEQALEMILAGKIFTATKARELGVIDDFISGDLLSSAIRFARSIQSDPVLPVSRRSDRIVPADPRCLAAARARQHPQLVAPPRIIEAIEAALCLPFEAALAREKALCDECLTNPQSHALRYAFFAERHCRKAPDGLAGTARLIDAVAIVGSGLEDDALVVSLLDAQIEVVLIEADATLSSRAIERITDLYYARVCEGDLTALQMTSCLDLMQASTDIGAIRAAALVIDARSLSTSQACDAMRTLDEIRHPDALLASHIASACFPTVAAATHRPTEFFGLNAFAQGDMRVWEIVHGPESAPDVLATALSLAHKARVVPVLVNTVGCSASARLRAAYSAAATQLLTEGASIESVEQALSDFGMTSSPFTGLEMGGVGYNTELNEQLAHRGVHALERECTALLLERRVLRGSDLDILAIAACGFPRWRGGPIYRANLLGAAYRK